MKPTPPLKFLHVHPSEKPTMAEQAEIKLARQSSGNIVRVPLSEVELLALIVDAAKALQRIRCSRG